MVIGRPAVLPQLSHSRAGAFFYRGVIMNKCAINVSVDDETKSRMDALRDSMGITIRAQVESALRAYLDRMESVQKQAAA